MSIKLAATISLILSSTRSLNTLAFPILHSFETSLNADSFEISWFLSALKIPELSNFCHTTSNVTYLASVGTKRNRSHMQINDC